MYKGCFADVKHIIRLNITSTALHLQNTNRKKYADTTLQLQATWDVVVRLFLVLFLHKCL